MTGKVMLNLLKNYKWQGVLASFRRTAMLVMIVPVLIFTLFAGKSYYDNLNKELDSKVEIACEKISLAINENFTELNQEHVTFSNDLTVKLYLADTYGDFSQSKDFQSLDWIRRLINTAQDNCENLSEIGVYGFENNYFYANKLGGYLDTQKHDWYEKCINEENYNTTYADDESIVVTKGIRIDGHPMGILVMKLDKSRLYYSLDLDKLPVNVAVKLETADGEELFKSGDVDAGKVLGVEVLSNNAVNCKVEVDSKSNTDIFYRTMGYSLKCLVISLAIAYIIAVLCATFLYQGVTKIIAKADTSEEKNIINASNTALGELSGNRNVEEELAEALGRLHTAQLTALQMQINPHFVFNTLNYANAVVQEITRSDNNAARIIVLLSDIFEYAMREPKYSAKIADEIEMAKEYVEIEKIKFSGEFDVVWNIDEKVLEYDSIKLFLQPIIENAITHGIKPLKDRKGIIEVSAKCEKDAIVFTVSDNGDGIGKDKLKDLREQLKKPYENYSKHIGMRNVNERAKMVYGNNYGVSIDSGSNGTKVTVKIGLRVNQNHK